MKLYKRLSALLLNILIAMMLLPIPVFAAGSIDLNRDVSVTISYQDGKKSLAGAEFKIYLVAAVDEYGELTATKPFSQFNVNIHGKNDTAWRTLASTLEGYVLRDHVTATDSGKTDEKGVVSFPADGSKLMPGLYLVLGQRHRQGGYRYDASPFMVMLPAQDEDTNEWVYHVTSSAKYESSRIPDRPDEPDTITRKVLKVWNDEGHEKERPQEITVQLLRNDQVYDTVTLKAGNNWRYTWNGLNDSYQWTVVETKLKDYNVTVTREGVTFVVTNTYTVEIPDEPIPFGPPTPPTTPDEPTQENPPLPQTGQLWWPVPFLLCAGLLFVVVGLLRHRGGKP